ncbi:MAG: peptidoglycan recognition protein family protein [Clostridiales bacterium]|nr:peptidoglycan recognition protein family protein [Clostridiales bacterium]
MKNNQRRVIAGLLALLLSICMISEVLAEEASSSEESLVSQEEENTLTEPEEPGDDSGLIEDTSVEPETTETEPVEPVEEPEPVYDLSEAVIGPIEALKYNGKERIPEIIVTYGDQTLVEGVDYELTFENNVNAGKHALVQVSGIGQYSGSISKYFKIKRVYNKITLSNVTRPYRVRKQSFYLKPELIDRAAKLTYSSNTSKVKVNSKGKVTIAKEFIGTAKITIACEETRNAAATSKTIKITVQAPVLGGKPMIQKYMTKSPKYKAKIPLKVKGLMLHSVNCPQPSALVFIRSWNDPGYTSASIHAFIDANTGEVYQTLPWTIQANHCWKGPKGCGNEMYIGVEMCESSYIEWVRWNKIQCSNKKKARAAAKRTYKSAVDLFAMLCVQFDLDPMEKGVVISHNEGNQMGIASNHGDPENIWKMLGMKYTMNSFRKAVKKAMEKYR